MPFYVRKSHFSFTPFIISLIKYCCKRSSNVSLTWHIDDFYCCSQQEFGATKQLQLFEECEGTKWKHRTRTAFSVERSIRVNFHVYSMSAFRFGAHLRTSHCCITWFCNSNCLLNRVVRTFSSILQWLNALHNNIEPLWKKIAFAYFGTKSVVFDCFPTEHRLKTDCQSIEMSLFVFANIVIRRFFFRRFQSRSAVFQSIKIPR